MKQRNVERAGFSAMILFEENTDSCVIMSGNDTEAATGQVIALSITSTAAAMLQLLATAGGSVYLSQPLRSVLFDPSELVLLALAVGTVLCGGLWAGAALEKSGVQPTALTEQRPITEENEVIITPRAAASFVFVASAALMSLYFFLNEWLALILTLLYALLAWQCSAIVMASILNAAPCSLTLRTVTVVIPLPFSEGMRAPATDLMAAIVSTGVTVSWLVLRNTHWAWIFQDILSVCVMLFILRSIHLPNLHVACILLPTALLYDVWWVFIQPMVTGGHSVMTAVATGGFNLPMLLAVPLWWGLGSNPGLTMLGLGDIVLPGLLVAFSRRWDVSLPSARRAEGEESTTSGRHGMYFATLIVSYAAGLLLTFVALAFDVGGQHGQPALLYLVPCSLGTMVLLGWVRGDLGALWKGQPRGPYPTIGRGADDDEETGASLLADEQ